MFHRHKGLPDGWADIVERGTDVWALLDDDERDLIAADADWLLRHKHWEAANGFVLDDTITVTIAVQAALLVLGRSVRLHPVAIIFAVAVGTTLAGIGGAILAVPIVAVLNSGVGALYRERRAE